MASYQAEVRVKPWLALLPLQLPPDHDWTLLALDLPALCRRLYGTTYLETESVCIMATCRLRRVYLAERLVGEEELPATLRLHRPH